MAGAPDQFAAQVRDAAASKRALRLRGSGSKDFYGGPLQGDMLDTRAYSGIVQYDPTELVVTARCGTPLAELESALAAKGQMLAFEPPHFGAGTLGGAVASGLSGPRRASVGALRDFVLGAKLMDGRGDVLGFGGQVMKNVAGYDVSRLLAGSMGTLGLVLEVSLKTLPLPVAEATLVFELPEDRAIQVLNQWAAKPLPISAGAWSGDALHLRLSGAAAAVKSACAALGGERVDDAAAAALWTGLREHTDAFFAQGDAPLWRLAVPPTTPPLKLPGDMLVEWGGGQRWLRTRADAASLREAAARAGGHATLFRADAELKAQAGAFQPLPPTLLAIHRRLKAEFDPAGIFNRGRLHPDF